MPTVADDPAKLGGLEGDVAYLRSVLDEIGGDVVLVGHSSGGIAAAKLADHPAVMRSVYVAAFLIPPGMSLSDLLANVPPMDWQVPRDDGAIAITDDIDVAHRSIAHDIDRDEFARYFNRFGLQAEAVLSAPVSAPSHPQRPVYVVCTEDRIIPVEAQKQMAAQVDAAVEYLSSSHCPMMSMPGQLAEVLARSV
jgi:pimeloyl-ACP methyl ester carboxylesterase